jgi:hypothetical protein
MRTATVYKDKKQMKSESNQLPTSRRNHRVTTQPNRHTLWRQWNPKFLIKRRLRHNNSCHTPHAAWAECSCQCQTNVKAFIIIAILSWCAFASTSDVNGDETCPQIVCINVKGKLLTFGGVSITICIRLLIWDSVIAMPDRPCDLVVRIPAYTTEMYCDSCEVRTEFIYVM